MKKYFLFFLLFLLPISYADISVLYKVQNKFLSDKQAFEQFTYLGELHCVDKQLGFLDNRLFNQGYMNLFNGLFAFPRLIVKERLEQEFLEFENKNLKNVKLYENKITKCRQLYRGKSSIGLYRKLILNTQNYYKATDEEYFTSPNEFEQHMIDYIKLGRIDRKRYF